MLTPTEMQRVVVHLAALARFYRYDVTTVDLDLYVTALDDVPLPALLAAMRQHMRVSKWFPKPVELRELAMGAPLDAAAVDSLVLGVLYDRPVPAACAPLVEAVLERLGPRRHLEDMLDGVRVKRIADLLPGVCAGLAAAGQRVPTALDMAGVRPPRLKRLDGPSVPPVELAAAPDRQGLATVRSLAAQIGRPIA